MRITWRTLVGILVLALLAVVLIACGAEDPKPTDEKAKVDAGKKALAPAAAPEVKPQPKDVKETVPTSVDKDTGKPQAALGADVLECFTVRAAALSERSSLSVLRSNYQSEETPEPEVVLLWRNVRSASSPIHRWIRA